MSSASRSLSQRNLDRALAFSHSLSPLLPHVSFPLFPVSFPELLTWAGWGNILASVLIPRDPKMKMNICVCVWESESVWSLNRWIDRCVVCMHTQVCVGVIRRMCAHVLYVGVWGNRLIFLKPGPICFLLRILGEEGSQTGILSSPL